MRIYLATKNLGKVREFETLLDPARFELATFPDYRDPEEGDASYFDNAALKARALRTQLATAGIVAHVLADDSGLEVAALDGRPGVTTAYYGGAALTWQQRRAALLHELSACSSDERAARFVCALHFIAANGAELATFATVDGTIAYADAGTAGFSFDPIFVYPPAGRTFAELTEAQKNAVSHRAVALAALTAGIVARGIADPPAQ